MPKGRLGSRSHERLPHVADDLDVLLRHRPLSIPRSGKRVERRKLCSQRPRVGSARTRGSVFPPRKKKDPQNPPMEVHPVKADDEDQIRQELERVAHSEPQSGREAMAKVTALRTLERLNRPTDEGMADPQIKCLL